MEKTTLIGKLTIGALYASIAAAILVAAILVVPKGNPLEKKVYLGSAEILATIADTKELQERGLSGYKGLDQNEGMLFVFPASGRYGFWMKDMLFPIDIIWFNASYQIVDIRENVSPDSYPEIYTPREDSLLVLEVPAGFARMHQIKIGDEMRF